MQNRFMVQARFPKGLFFTMAQIGGQARQEKHGGVEYLIAPAVAIKAGVLNNRLVSGEPIRVSTALWHGVPSPLGAHPQMYGQYISANTPELTASNPARFWNPYYDNGALKGEIWIDIERANALGGDPEAVVEQLQQGQVLENSTAYFADEIVKSGTWQGKSYQYIVTQIFPDHLAVLLHQVGACSVADGCGVLANSSSEKEQFIMTNGDVDILGVILKAMAKSLPTDEKVKLLELMVNHQLQGQIAPAAADLAMPMSLIEAIQANHSQPGLVTGQQDDDQIAMPQSLIAEIQRRGK
jgi:hypothetical protein